MGPIHTSSDSPDSRVELGLFSKSRPGFSLFHSDLVRAKFCLQNNKATWEYNLFLVTNLAALISPLLGRWQANWKGSQASGSVGSVFIVHLILYMSYIIFCFQPIISFMICMYVVFQERKTMSLFSPTFSFPRCHFLLFDFLVMSVLGVTIRQRRECKEIGVVDKAALWIPSWGCPHEKEDSSRIETTYTIVRGIFIKSSRTWQERF